ncbi:MAG: antitoxin VapB family protein [Candidatus Micrarchaeota archaeon]|nr:antitoxin VapB family protein [Candidatus Micrarchaeota archaeon]
MVVKTITVTESAYQRLKSQKHGDESFSEVILRVFPKMATADDFFGICRGTEEDAEEFQRKVKIIRKEVSKNIEERIKRVSARFNSPN